MKAMTKLSILIPVRDETLNLKIMLKILNAVVSSPYEILVIFDSLEDESIAVVQAAQQDFPHILAVHNQLGRGIANALRSGVEKATGDRILIFAADEVGPVLAIEDMMQLMDTGCDFVSCTRYAYGGRRLGGSLIGHILSKTANYLIRYLSSTSLTDSTTGIKLFRKEDFARLTDDLEAVGWAIAFEMAINAQILGLKLGEVPIISIDRLFGGKSTFRVIPWVRSYLNYFVRAMRKLPPWKKQHPVSIRIPINIGLDNT